jgi:hypothetical protein
VKSTKSEYPKKGKTRIPVRLVSKRALIDIGYPFTEEVRLDTDWQTIPKEMANEVFDRAM